MPSTIRVKAVEGRHAQYFGADNEPRLMRFCGRGPGPDFAILPDGEEIPDVSENRRHLAAGVRDLVLADAPIAAKETE